MGELDLAEKPIFWRLKFIDSEETNHVVQFQINSTVEYSLSQQKLFRVTSRDRQEISLQGKELIFIDYMSRKNEENNHQPVICQYKELIQAIWQQDAFGVDKLDIHHLAWRIRHKIEPDSGESQFLKTVRGRGYRLEIQTLN
ncbi:MAG: helix-turn-helix domain-containing protein [Pleurocapsa sp.]